MKPPVVAAIKRVLVAALAVYLLDQVTKHWVFHHVQPGPFDAVNVIGDWFQILFTQNKGLILGLGRGSPLFVDLVIVVATVILLAYAYSEIQRGTNPMALVGVGMIFGGAAGNLTDRIRLTYVIDFIAIGRWPVFNFADASIVTGVLVLVASYYLEEQAAQKAAAKAAEEALLAELPPGREGPTETTALDGTPGDSSGANPSSLSESALEAPAEPPAQPSDSAPENP